MHQQRSYRERFQRDRSRAQEDDPATLLKVREKNEDPSTNERVYEENGELGNI
jgi:hypothetical protein